MRDFLQRLTVDAELDGEPMPGRTIVELSGDNRVLIENHSGVRGYSREQILVGVKFGCVHVCGCGLEILRMTKEQLVICGRIDQIRLHRRDRNGGR